MDCKWVMSVLIDKRSEEAVNVQKILTEYGCGIHARFGLHESGGESCTEEGLILLYLCDTDKKVLGMERKLQSLDGITVKSMKIK